MATVTSHYAGYHSIQTSSLKESTSPDAWCSWAPLCPGEGNIWCAVSLRQPLCGSQAFLAFSNLVSMSLAFNSRKRDEMGCLDPGVQLDRKMWGSKRDAKNQGWSLWEGNLKISRMDQGERRKCVSAGGEERGADNPGCKGKTSDAPRSTPPPGPRPRAPHSEYFPWPSPVFQIPLVPWSG